MWPCITIDYICELDTINFHFLKTFCQLSSYARFYWTEVFYAKEWRKPVNMWTFVSLRCFFFTRTQTLSSIFIYLDSIHCLLKTCCRTSPRKYYKLKHLKPPIEKKTSKCDSVSDIYQEVLYEELIQKVKVQCHVVVLAKKDGQIALLTFGRL